MSTLDPRIDAPRIATQLELVRDLMLDGEWRTFAEISTWLHGKHAVLASEAGISARLRDLRKPQHGAWQVERRRVGADRGLWEYRVLPAHPRQRSLGEIL
jgi:hypothetical protein